MMEYGLWYGFRFGVFGQKFQARMQGLGFRV
jgi:hypothetical protein